MAKGVELPPFSSLPPHLKCLFPSSHTRGRETVGYHKCWDNCYPTAKAGERNAHRALKFTGPPPQSLQKPGSRRVEGPDKRESFPHSLYIHSWVAQYLPDFANIGAWFGPAAPTARTVSHCPARFIWPVSGAFIKMGSRTQSRTHWVSFSSHKAILSLATRLRVLPRHLGEPGTKGVGVGLGGDEAGWDGGGGGRNWAVEAKIFIKALLRFLSANGPGQLTELTLPVLVESSLPGGALVLSPE